jgi:putative transposase
MPRKPSLHSPGGLYHVILRGNNRQDILDDDADRLELEKFVATGLDRYGCRLHAYCWMSNHIHMAVQVDTIPLGSLMRWIASQFARSWNKVRRCTGHVFERRHRAILVNTDQYALQLVRYIHLNPVKAGMVDHAEEYAWSSHGCYLGLTENPWLTTDWVLSQFSNCKETAQHRFARFIKTPNDDQYESKLISPSGRDVRILDDDELLSSVSERSTTEFGREELNEIITRICDVYGVTETMLASTNRSRKLARIRAEIADIALYSSGATLAEIAKRFRRAESVLCRAVHRYRSSTSFRNQVN